MALLAITRRMSQKFYVLCGEDALTFSSLCLGGDGAIVTVGYSIGKGPHEMMQAFARGDSKAAQDIHRAIATAGRAQPCHTPAALRQAFQEEGGALEMDAETVSSYRTLHSSCYQASH